MIEPYKIKNNLSLLCFLQTNQSSDFYFTENNIRYFIKTEEELKKLLKESSYIYISTDISGDINGVILVWTSVNINGKRDFVKIKALNEDIYRRLLTQLLWNYTRKDLFCKTKKDNQFLNILKEKNFYFCGDRGTEILMRYNKFLVTKH